MRIFRGTPKHTVKLNPLPLCRPQIPHDLGSNPFRSSGKPMTNRLGYGTAFDDMVIEYMGCLLTKVVNVEQ
jgi:hypothetical protein